MDGSTFCCPATDPPLGLAVAWSAKDLLKAAFSQPLAPPLVAVLPPQLMGRWIQWSYKITGPSDETTGSVVGATPLTRHHSGGVGLRSSCHLCVPLGGTVSTSQDALVSHYHQKRLQSTLCLLLLNRCWALTRVWIKAPDWSFWKNYSLVFSFVSFSFKFTIDWRFGLWHWLIGYILTSWNGELPPAEAELSKVWKHLDIWPLYL